MDFNMFHKKRKEYAGSATKPCKIIAIPNHKEFCSTKNSSSTLKNEEYKFGTEYAENKENEGTLFPKIKYKLKKDQETKTPKKSNKKTKSNMMTRMKKNLAKNVQLVDLNYNEISKILQNSSEER